MSELLTLAPPRPHAVTRGPAQHFFGYYDKSPWDATGRWMLGLETQFMDRPPMATDVAVIGLIDTREDNAWTPLAETTAWNWQQGCMLQWLGDGRAGEIIFNDRRDGELVARVLNVHTGAAHTLDRPIYSVNAAGTHAVSLNFARLHHQRPGYGYAGTTDPWFGVNEPEDDGIYSLDLVSGDSALILSIAEAGRRGRLPDFDGRLHRFNHLQFAPVGNRFAGLHRRKTPHQSPGEVGETRLFTLGLDGSDWRCLSDHGLVSHYDWHGEDAILAWARHRTEGEHYFLFQDADGGRIEAVGEDTLTCDGHCSFSPDRQWLLTDTYPDETDHRTLILYHWATGERLDLGRFHAPPRPWQIRCDLHPRWSRDGNQICIDSLHEGTRQIYTLDVSGLVSR